ncbi:MAG: cohesin domain-containing protein, partial [Candidatus Cyclobacteriaceae bacterium M3_2C_046]
LPTQYTSRTVLAYSEPTDNWVDPGSSIIAPGTGVSVYVESEDITGGAFNVDFTGPAVTGDVNVTLTKQGSFEDGGWNLVANPYLCTVDWDVETGWNKSNINNSIYFWNQVSQSYNVYVGSGGSNLTGVATGSASQYIPAGQAFFVKASNGGTFSVNEDAKVTDQNPTFLREKAPKDILRIALKNSDNLEDEAVIRFGENATVQFDKNMDAVKWYGNILNLSSITPDGKKLAVNTLPYGEANSIIPLEVKVKQKGDYSISFSGIHNFSDNVLISLKDNLNGKITAVNNQTIYPFKVTVDSSSYVDRFEIIFSTPVIFSFDNKKAKAGSYVTVPLTVKNYENIITTQFTVRWDQEQLSYQEVQNFGISSMSTGNFGTTNIENGYLTFSWDQADLQPQSLADDESLFDIIFKLKSSPGDSSEIYLDDLPLTIEIASGDLIKLNHEVNPGWIGSFNKVNVAGQVKDRNGKPIENVKVSLYENIDSMDTLTNEEGTYHFELLDKKPYNLKVDYTPTNNLIQGVSTIDIAYLRRHILGVSQLTAPLAVLAGDVDGSKSISTIDIAHIRSHILGKTSILPVNRAFKFYPDDLIDQDPFLIPENFKVEDYDKDSITVDFTGIKLGDVDNSWSNTNMRIRETNPVEFAVLSTFATEASEINIPISVKGFKDISAFQFTLEWDPKVLEFVKVNDKDFDVHVGEQMRNKGIVTISWDDVQGESISIADNSDLMNLRFKVKGGSGSKSDIQITSNYTEALAADRELNPIRFNTLDGHLEVLGDLNQLRLLQNYPNPFTDNTHIQFILPERGQVDISIYDSFGRLMHHIKKICDKGYNKVVINKNDIGKTGLYHYSIYFNGNVNTKQMILK